METERPSCHVQEDFQLGAREFWKPMVHEVIWDLAIVKRSKSLRLGVVSYGNSGLS